MAQQSKSDKKDRQRKSAQNLRYRNERRHAKSHVVRLTKHLVKQPDDDLAIKALAKYAILSGGYKPKSNAPNRPRLRG